MLLLLLNNALACDPSDLVRAEKRGEEAFAQNDIDAVTQASKDAAKALRCTTPTPEQLARLHRLSAYHAGLERDWATAEESWRASLAAHPLLPPEKALWANPRLHLAWARAQETGVQYSVSSSRQPIAGIRTPLIPNTKPLKSSKQGQKRTLRSAGVGLLAAAGGLYGGAWAARVEYDRQGRDGEKAADRRLMYNVTNSLSIASAGVATLGGALLVVSIAR